MEGSYTVTDMVEEPYPSDDDPMLLAGYHERWQQDGFFIIPRFSSPSTCDAMLDRAVELARTMDYPHGEQERSDEDRRTGTLGSPILAPENNLRDRSDPSLGAETRVSKIFKIHRDSVFHDFATDPALVALIHPLLGGEVDCFLSQFIFKNPGAWGQPWHQDSHYFPFDRAPQVGVWLAVTEATLDNGCLHVLAGSQREPTHRHVLDPRPNANQGYVEIVDHDMSGSVPVLMDPGDLLVFHSQLMHRSLDNTSAGVRAAMVYHYAHRGTVDQSDRPAIINDWLPVPDGVAS